MEGVVSVPGPARSVGRPVWPVMPTRGTSTRPNFRWPDDCSKKIGPMIARFQQHKLVLKKYNNTNSNCPSLLLLTQPAAAVPLSIPLPLHHVYLFPTPNCWERMFIRVSLTVGKYVNISLQKKCRRCCKEATNYVSVLLHFTVILSV